MTRSTAPADSQSATSPRSRLTVAPSSDPAERHADAVADHVLSMPAPGSTSAGDGAGSPSGPGTPATNISGSLFRAAATSRSPGMTVNRSVDAAITSRQGKGSSLPSATRQFFEPRFGADLSRVRVHTDAGASKLAAQVQARAFSVGTDVFFGAGQWSPSTQSGSRLIAHELAHTQQGSARIHRTLEARPPGRGEASAFDRKEELVERLTAISPAVEYSYAVDGRTIEYNVLKPGDESPFDQRMIGFIDAGQVIPLRMITSAGRVRDRTGTFVPLTGDSFVTAYLDLDDLLGSSDLGFQLLLTHFITERLAVRNYARLIGTAALARQFDRAHALGRVAEAELLQELLGDPTVRHHYDELKPNQTTFVRAFISDDEGYRVFWVIRGHAVRSTISITDIRVVDGTRRLTLEDFIAEREAARAAAPAGAGGP